MLNHSLASASSQQGKHLIEMQATHMLCYNVRSLKQEVARKIVDLMWNDWNSDVRQAAGQALGRTGQGKVH